MTRIADQLKTGPGGAVQLDQELSKLKQASSLQEIGASLKAISAQLGKGQAPESVPEAAKVALKNKPAGLRDILGDVEPDQVKLFLGTSSPAEARAIAKEAGVPIGNHSFKIFSTGDPFVFLGEPPDGKAKKEAQVEDVAGRTVYVVQGSKPDGSKYDLPTLVAEALQVAYAAVENDANRAVLVLPESLNPATHPNDKFAALVHRLAIATGIHTDDIKYTRDLDPQPQVTDGKTKEDVRLGLPALGPKTKPAEQALTQLQNAKDLSSISEAITKLDLAISGLEGKYSKEATKLAKQVADVLAERMIALVPGFADNAVLTTAEKTIVLGGQSNPELASEIAKNLGAGYSTMRLDETAGGSPRVDLGGSVAGKQVVIVQTSREDPAKAPEDRHSTMSMLAEALMAFQSAVERGAKDVRLVLPYMPSARSDKKDQEGVGAYADLVARWVDAIVDDGSKLAEARQQRTEYRPRVYLVEMHDPHVRHFFRTPVTAISGAEVLTTKVIDDVGKDHLILVRPDAGAAKRTATLGKRLHLPVIDGEKTRSDNNENAQIERLARPDDIRGKKVLVVDDEIATGGTMRQTASLLAFERDDKGKIVEGPDGPWKLAAEVHVAVSHANMPIDLEERHKAMRALREAGATRLYLLDTQPVGPIPPDLQDFVKVVSAADAIALGIAKTTAEA
jgi:ribose-phosphate pyrophosphokinase